jgi:hypothetical protein
MESGEPTADQSRSGAKFRLRLAQLATDYEGAAKSKQALISLRKATIGTMYEMITAQNFETMICD